MPDAELVYDADCPNVGLARRHLARALAQAGLPARWTEWRSDNPGRPAHACGYGSPSVLVGGRDVAGAEPSEGVTSCRFYLDQSGSAGRAPAVELILAALRGWPAGGTASSEQGA